MDIEVIKDMTGGAVLIRMGEHHYVVSSVDVPITGFETLVFEADETGHVANRVEVAGGRGMDREQAIAHLQQRRG